VQEVRGRAEGTQDGAVSMLAGATIAAEVRYRPSMLNAYILVFPLPSTPDREYPDPQ